MSCQCVTVAQAARYIVRGMALPVCESHDPPPPADSTEPAPIALNDDQSLTSIILATLTAPTQGA